MATMEEPSSDHVVGDMISTLSDELGSDGGETDAIEYERPAYEDAQLWCAIRNGDSSEVEQQLARSPRCVWPGNLTAAVQQPSLDIFWKLINHELAVTNAENLHWQSGAVLAAARMGRLDPLKGLIRCSPYFRDFDLLERYGAAFTPLRNSLVAPHIQDFEIGQYLERKRFRWWLDGLECLSSMDSMERLLLDLVDGRRRLADHLWKSMRIAVSCGHVHIVGFLAGIGIPLQWADECAMSIAVASGQLVMTQFLRKLGIEFKAEMLFDAIKGGHDPIVKYLLDNGLDPNVRAGARFPFELAVLKRNVNCMELLLSKGASVTDLVDLGEIFYKCISHAFENGNADGAEQLQRCKWEWKRFLEREIPGPRLVASTHYEEFYYDPSTLPCWTRAILQRGRGQVPIWERQVPMIFYFSRANIRDVFTAANVQRRLVTSTSLSLENSILGKDAAAQCPFRVRAKARERQQLRRHLRERFFSIHDKALGSIQSSSTSFELATFGETISSAHVVWKKGFRAIRELKNNHLPSSVLEVFGCIQVARAMEETIGGSMLDNSNDNPRGDLLRSPTAGLDRWKAIVEDSDKTLFDEICSLVWDLSEPFQSFDHRWTDTEMSSYFKGLMDRLVHETYAACYADPEETCDSYTSKAPSDRSSNWQHVNEHASLISSPNYDWVLSVKSNSKSSQIWLLAATSIFMMIVAFLAVLRNPLMNFADQLVLLRWAKGGSFWEFCYILSFCLGMITIPSDSELSDQSHSSNYPSAEHSVDPTHTSASENAGNAPSIDQDIMVTDWTPTTFTPPDLSRASQLQCPQCSKAFSTVTNRNKHVKTDCPKGTTQSFPCRNPRCSQVLSRKEYRNVHEKDKCRYRDHAMM